MESKEHTYNDKESRLNYYSNRSNYEVNVDWLGLVDYFHDVSNEQRDFAWKGEDEGEDDIEKKKHKELSIAKSNTIRDPRTVMVHIKYASLTRRTMMTTTSQNNYR